MLLFGRKEGRSESITHWCKNILQCILAPRRLICAAFLMGYKIKGILGLHKRGATLRMRPNQSKRKTHESFRGIKEEVHREKN
jgi:hypothetical protein